MDTNSTPRSCVDPAPAVAAMATAGRPDGQIMVGDSVAVVSDNCFWVPIGSTGKVEHFGPKGNLYGVRLDPPARTMNNRTLAVFTADEVMRIEA